MKKMIDSQHAISSTVPSPKPPRSHFEEHFLRRLLDYIFDPRTGTVELRIPEAEYGTGNFIVPCTRVSRTLSGWYDNANDLCLDAKKCKNIHGYITVNPVHKSLLTRSPNKTKIGGKRTSDADITCIRWAFLDIDPERTDNEGKKLSNSSSSDAELQAAIEVRNKILTDHPEMRNSSIWGMSGNGCWILVRLNDLPNNADTEDAVTRFLAVVGDAYDTDRVKIDSTTKNASRIMCIPGTSKYKGRQSAERPWRMSTFDDAGFEPSIPVPFNLARWLSTQPAPKPRKDKGANGGLGTPSAGLRPPWLGEEVVRGVGPTVSSSGQERARKAFAAKVLEEEVAKVESAPNGEWNNTLNKAAVACFGLVPYLDPEEIASKLVVASAKRNHSGHEVTTTIASGRDYGLANPRDLSGVGTRANVVMPPLWETGHQGILPVEEVRSEEIGSQEGESGELPAFSYDDQGNGERFAHIYKNRVFFNSSDDKAYIYDRRWEIDNSYTVEYMAKCVVNSMSANIQSLSEQLERNPDDAELAKLHSRAVKWYQNSRNVTRLSAMIRCARSEPGMSNKTANLDQHPWLLNVQNGTVNLQTGELLPHDPKNLITKISPVVYDPEAKCPTFDKFLSDITSNDQELIKYIAKVFGYSATGQVT